MSDLQFVGKGEVAAVKILEELTGLWWHHIDAYGYPGIYTQVPMKKLITLDIYQTLNDILRKGTADIVIITRDYDVIVVRIQGKVNHGEYAVKTKDTPQKYYLKASGRKVVDIHYYDATELFKNKINETSKAEIFWAFKNAGCAEYLKC